MLSIASIAHCAKENSELQNYRVKIILYICCFYEIKIPQNFIPRYFKS